MLHAYRVTFPEIKGRFGYLGGRSFKALVPDDMRRALSFYQIETESVLPGVDQR